MLKRSFISTFKPEVHTKTWRERSFPSSNPRNLKTTAFHFRVDVKHSENGALWKRWRHDNHVISLPQFSSNTNPEWPVIVVFINSSGLMCTENIWCVLRLLTSFSNSPTLCKRGVISSLWIAVYHTLSMEWSQRNRILSTKNDCCYKARNVHMESTRAKAWHKTALASATKMRDVTTVTQFMLTFSLHEEL